MERWWAPAAASRNITHRTSRKPKLPRVESRALHWSTSMIDDNSEKLPFNLADLPSEPLGDQARQMSPFDLAALRHRRSAGGSDVADRVDGASDAPPGWLGSAALGLVPGAGFADVLGLLPDLEKGG